ncbi:MAG: EAL domain-containing protein [Afipia sp.]|nr:EAL domain-containing protein [Afipia sp.]
MIRMSTIFIAICMVLIAASLGLMTYSLAAFSAFESSIVALAALTVMILYNTVSMRLRDRAATGGQIADLSRGTTDLARQVAEFGRRLSALEGRLPSGGASGHDRIQTLAGEISELGSLVRQLAGSVAAHDDLLSQTAPAPIPVTPVPVTPVSAIPVSAAGATDASRAPASTNPAPAGNAHIVAAVRNAVEANRVDLYLQPMVSLPQRKVRFYEAVARLRDDSDQVMNAGDFLAAAEAAGLMGRIDNTVLFRCVQVLRRLMVRSKDVGMFCNVSAATLSDPEAFRQCLDFLDANRVLAPSLVLEFKQHTFRHLGPVESEHLATLHRLGYRFSIDNVGDLRLDPRELADRGVKYIKIPASLLLDQSQLASADIHAADLADLLSRYGIDLVAERIEGERSVVDLLDYDVRFGQGFLFAPPRPLRPDVVAAAAVAPVPAGGTGPSAVASAAGKDDKAAAPTEAGGGSPRATGNAALVRRASAQK